MTLRNSFRKRPPFPFSHRARLPNIPCQPVISLREPSHTYFAELFMALGPQTIGDTGDNSFQHLFGREWLVIWCDDDLKLHAFQESATTNGVWEAVTTPLPPVFDSALPATTRRVSFAFDQSARMVVALEDEGVVKVTRWDAALNQYVQNVSFAGVDPTLVMDATWAGRIPNSDVLLFYLPSDRTKIVCRVQAQAYAVEHDLHEYGTPVILDRAAPLTRRYELLVGDADGLTLDYALVSSMYPVFARSRLTVLGEFLSGAHEKVAERYEATLPIEAFAEFVSGALDVAVTVYKPSFGAAASTEFTAGVLRNVVTQYAPTLVLSAASEFASAELADIGSRSESRKALAASGEFIGGAYEPG